MKRKRLLVVDDDPLVLESIRLALPESWEFVGFSGSRSIPKGDFDALFVDIHLSKDMEKTEGLRVIHNFRLRSPDVEIVAMSGDLNPCTMEKALRGGASRFLAKPLNFEEIALTLSQIDAMHQLSRESKENELRPCWIGQSLASVQIRNRIAILSRESGPILIEGESGTGKEVVASLLSYLSPHKKMISVNVAAISETLFESEFFGHIKGAFTGADQNKMGLAEASNGGQLFLDEIEALSLPMQVKLLRFLENGEIRRVGSEKVLTVDSQVIVATNKNLEEMMVEGKFREDLLWRLNGKKIFLPPLRSRIEDIEGLACHFLSLDKVRKKELSKGAIGVLQEYSWPGNVRELKRACERLLVDSPLPLIREEDVVACLPIYSLSNPYSKPLESSFEGGLNNIINSFEAETIRKCLRETGSLDKASEILKVSRSSLYKKVKDHKIKWKAI